MQQHQTKNIEYKDKDKKGCADDEKRGEEKEKSEEKGKKEDEKGFLMSVVLSKTDN